MDTQKAIIRSMMKTGLEFIAQKPWVRFGGEALIRVNLESWEGLKSQPLIAPKWVFLAIGGGAELPYSLTILDGPQALNMYRSMAACVGLDPQIATDRISIWYAQWMPFEKLHSRDRRFLHKMCPELQPQDYVPACMAKPGSNAERDATDDECLMIMGIARAFLDAFAKDALLVTELGNSSGLCTLTLSGSLIEPTWKVSLQQHSFNDPSLLPPSNRPAMLELQDRRDIPHLETTWKIGFMPVQMLDKKSHSVPIPWLLIVDGQSDEILYGHPVENTKPESAVKLLKSFIHGQSVGVAGRQTPEKGIANELIFSSPAMWELLDQELLSAGISAESTPMLPEVAWYQLSLQERKLPAHPPSGELPYQELPPPAEITVHEIQPGEIPEPDDEAGWAEVHDKFLAILPGVEKLEAYKNPEVRAIYFGRPVDGELFERLIQTRARRAFETWLAIYYQAPDQEASWGKLYSFTPECPKDLMVAIWNRFHQAPSLYEVVARDPETGLLLLEDLLLKNRHAINDHGLVLEPGMAAVLLIYEGGKTRFADLLGPVMPALVGHEAVKELKRLKLDFSAPGQQEHAELFGHLWRWLEQQKT